MQNAQNLMSSFEFIAALMSIIIGLGVTNLLAGAGRAFYRRKENPLDEVHIVLTVATLLLLVLQWWVTFRWNTEVNPLPARPLGSGRTPGPLRTEPRRLLFHLHRDVFARRRANGSSWRTFSTGVVCAVRGAICAARRRRPHCQPT